MEEAVARANSNVALIQSWGTRVPALNLPYTGSISMTLQGLETKAHVCFETQLRDDQMHAVSFAARPALLYWTPATIAVIEGVAQLRNEGIEAYFSIDAGPQPASSITRAWLLRSSCRMISTCTAG